MVDLAHFERVYRQTSRFDDSLGMVLTVDGPGQIRYQLTVQEQHLSSPGACHGGVLAAMMDAVLGVTALSWAVPGGKLCATVEFKINYFSPASVGDVLEGRGTLDFTGGKLVVTSAEIIDQARHKVIAKGLGTFALYPMDRKTHLSALLSGSGL